MLSKMDLQKIEITSIEEGHKVVNAINARIKLVLLDMQSTSNNEIWKELADKKYELVKARRIVQNEMGRLVTGKKCDWCKSKPIKQGGLCRDCHRLSA